MNGILAGLVSITGCCNVVQPWASIIIGVIGSCVYSCACRLTEYLEIDDPLEAFQVHGCCGFWSIIAYAIFEKDKGLLQLHVDSANLLGAQCLGIVAISSWAILWSVLFSYVVKRGGHFRLSEEDEILGGDLYYFGPAEFDGDINEIRNAIDRLKDKV